MFKLQLNIIHQILNSIIQRKINNSDMTTTQGNFILDAFILMKFDIKFKNACTDYENACNKFIKVCKTSSDSSTPSSIKLFIELCIKF